MSANPGREDRCKSCGHSFNEHAHKRDLKCTKCGKLFEMCQQTIHGDGSNRTWRLCFVPCYCGKEFYPPKAKAATPLAPHEYEKGHQAYRPLDDKDMDEDEDEDENEDEYENEGKDGGEPSVLPQNKWSAGHARVISTDSEDPLAWTDEEYIRKTTIADLTDRMDATYVSRDSELGYGEWSWNKEWMQWVRDRETSPGKWENEYRPLIGEWSDWVWDDTAGQYASSAKDPEGIWRYEHTPGVEDSSLGSSSTVQKGKGQEVQDDTSTTAAKFSSADGMLVAILREEKKRKVFYYFQNEEGGNVPTQERDWKRSTRKVDGVIHNCLEYTGKKSGRVYYTWKLGKA